jgi:glycosyltransferase involved in cell wall biosynthesis
MKPKKIAFFLSTLVAGGAQQVFIDLAKGFLRNNYQVDFVLKKKGGEYLSKVPKQIKVYDLGASRLIASLLPLVSYLQKYKPDILISGLELPNTIALISSLISHHKPKVIISIHNIVDSSFEKRNLKYGIELLIQRLLFPKADVVICVSNGVAEDAQQYFNLPSEKVRIIYNPVDIDKVRSKSKEKIGDRFIFDEANTYFIIGVGRLTPRKDFSTLIRAFNIAHHQVPSKLIIFGEGEQRQELEELVQNLGLIDQVILPGYVPNPYIYMAHSDVLVVSSVEEGFGLVIIEALAVGCPVVSTNCPGGTMELLDNGEYGEIVPMGDEISMASAIIKTIDASPKPVDEVWLTQFSHIKIIQEYIRIIENLA